MTDERILIAEDEAITGLHLTRVLEDYGFSVIGVVRSGEEAVRRASQDSPDLVLMDVVLKGTLGGVAAASEIHRRYGIPTVFITAFTPNELLQHGDIAETFDYVSKPIDFEELRRKLRTMLDRSTGAGAGRGSTSESNSPSRDNQQQE